MNIKEISGSVRLSKKIGSDYVTIEFSEVRELDYYDNEHIDNLRIKLFNDIKEVVKNQFLEILERKNNKES